MQTTESGTENYDCTASNPTVSRRGVLISHPTGNQNLRHALVALESRKMLAEFWTTIAWNRNSLWARLLPARLRAELARRSFNGVARSLVHCWPWREMGRLALRSFRATCGCVAGEKRFSVIGVYRDFDARVARRLRKTNAELVYAYEGGALHTFREARRLGIPRIYELPSSYWHWNIALADEEARLRPEFAGLLMRGWDSQSHLRWKDEELALADAVIVPSEHVKNTLAGVVAEKNIYVVPYGAPELRGRRKEFSQAGQSLRLLFVGALQQRKGIGYLLDAIEALEFPVELTLIGAREGDNQRIDAACRRWRWYASLPHEQVLEQMLEADVLVHPSLTEGCALAVLEALAMGLPVIVTPNSGTLGFVRDACEGFVVPIRDAAAIADRLRRLDGNRDLLVCMSRQAQVTASKQSWARYQQQWISVVQGILHRVPQREKKENCASAGRTRACRP